MGRVITLSMAVLMTIGGTGAVISYLMAAPDVSETAQISGAWKIDSGNDRPSPTCGFQQAGNDLTGSCIGPNAKGTITGTVVGTQVRWRWQYTINSSAAFDFIGTLTPDNTITGVLERRETGLSLKFTAKRLSPDVATATEAAQPARTAGAAQTRPMPTPEQVGREYPHSGTAEEFNKYISWAIQNQRDFNNKRTGGQGGAGQGPQNSYMAQFQPRAGDPLAEEFNNIRQRANSIFGNSASANPAREKYIVDSMLAAQANAARLRQIEEINRSKPMIYPVQ
jgi:hypothetical protein